MIRTKGSTATDDDHVAAGSVPANVTDEPGGRRPRRQGGRALFEIAGELITPGKRQRLELPIGNLMSGTAVALPLIVVHGKKDGPVVWLSGAVHGDEICGVEIIRQVLAAVSAPTMRGTVIAAPIVNVHGFNTDDRYMPDRRDLNRSFPGSVRGSTRLADRSFVHVRGRQPERRRHRSPHRLRHADEPAASPMRARPPRDRRAGPCVRRTDHHRRESAGWVPAPGRGRGRQDGASLRRWRSESVRQGRDRRWNCGGVARC